MPPASGRLGGWAEEEEEEQADEEEINTDPVPDQTSRGSSWSAFNLYSVFHHITSYHCTRFNLDNLISVSMQNDSRWFHIAVLTIFSGLQFLFISGSCGLTLVGYSLIKHAGTPHRVTCSRSPPKPFGSLDAPSSSSEELWRDGLPLPLPRHVSYLHFRLLCVCVRVCSVLWYNRVTLVVQYLFSFMQRLFHLS